MTPILHYIHDPLCGWCYGAAPLIAAVKDIVKIAAHGGGMMSGNNRRSGSEAFREQIAPMAGRIEALTGQHIGEPYVNGLLREASAVFDSEPPITAMLAVDMLAAEGASNQTDAFTGLDMLARIQAAQFVEGRRITEVSVLSDIAVEAGLHRDAFTDSYDRVAGATVKSHMRRSREFLRRVGGHGFPTFVWEVGGRYDVLEIGRWLGNADGWRDSLARHAALVGAAV